MGDERVNLFSTLRQVLLGRCDSSTQSLRYLIQTESIHLKRQCQGPLGHLSSEQLKASRNTLVGCFPGGVIPWIRRSLKEFAPLRIINPNDVLSAAPCRALMIGQAIARKLPDPRTCSSVSTVAIDIPYHLDKGLLKNVFGFCSGYAAVDEESQHMLTGPVVQPPERHVHGTSALPNLNNDVFVRHVTIFSQFAGSCRNAAAEPTGRSGRCSCQSEGALDFIPNRR